jgi:hypothetical protein
LFWVKTPIFRQFFGENILKIIASVSGSPIPFPLLCFTTVFNYAFSSGNRWMSSFGILIDRGWLFRSQWMKFKMEHFFIRWMIKSKDPFIGSYLDSIVMADTVGSS